MVCGSNTPTYGDGGWTGKVNEGEPSTSVEGRCTVVGLQVEGGGASGRWLKRTPKFTYESSVRFPGKRTKVYFVPFWHTNVICATRVGSGTIL